MAKQAWLEAATSRDIVRNAATTALIVGPILTVINQGDMILAGQAPDWIKVVLTFFVPYAVATVAGANARTRDEQNQESPDTAATRH